MIKYSLLCDECNTKFDGWFPNSKEYDEQKKKKLLQCPICDSQEVDKAIMSPNIGKKNNQKKVERVKEIYQNKTMMPASQANNIMRRISRYVTKNFENVGDNFFDEVKKNIKGERNDKFYGTPTDEEVNKLLDDGVDLFHVPKVKDN